ncbi:beta strand repeat-containing protein, partial [Alkalispirochaeta americana]
MVLVGLLFLVTGVAWGQTTYTSSGDGVWSAATTWSPEGIPGSDDTVIVQNGHTVTLTADAEATSLFLEGTGTLSTGIHGLTVSGLVNGDAGSQITSTDGAIDLNQIAAMGTLDVSGGTLEIKEDSSITNLTLAGVGLSPAKNVSVGALTVSGDLTITVGAGNELRVDTLTNTGSLDVSLDNSLFEVGKPSDTANLGTLTMENGSTLDLTQGDFTAASLTSDAASSVQLNDSNLTITNFTSTNTPVISSGGSLSVGAMAGGNGTFIIEGEFNAFSAPVGATVRLGAQVEFAGDVALNMTADGGFQANGFPVIFSGTTILTLGANFTFETIRIGTGGSLTLAGGATTVFVRRDWENRGIFDAGGKIVEFVAGSGPSQILGNTTFFGLRSTANDKVLIFEAESTQTVSNTLNLSPDTITRYISLQSSVPGVQWTINSSVAGTNNYLFVSDANSSNAQINVGAVSFNLGNVTGQWSNFSDAINRTWTGGNNENWNDDTNWDGGGSPDADNLRVLIPSGLSVYPVLDANRQVRQLFLGGIATLNLNDHTLTQQDGLRNNGTIIFEGTNSASTQVAANSGTVRYQGDFDYTAGVGWTGAQYFNLTVAVESTRTLTAVDGMNINGSLSVLSGALGLGGHTVTVGGNISSSVAEPFSGTGTIRIANNAVSNTSGALNFHNLTIDTGAVLNLGGDISISGNFVNNGILNTNGYKVTFNGTIGTPELSGNVTTFDSIEIADASSLTVNQTIRLRGNWTNNGTFTPETNTVEFLAGSGPSTIRGETSFHTLRSVAPGKDLVFESGRTQTIENLVLKGSSDNLISLTATGFDPFVIAHGSVAGTDVDYVSVSNSDVTGTYIDAKFNSVNGGNVTIGSDDPVTPGWIFRRDVYQWTGSVDTSWTTPGNWTRASGDPVTQAPGIIDWVLIPGGRTRYPEIIAPVSVANLNVASGGELTVAGDGNVQTGFLNNEGRIVLDGTGTINRTDTDSGIFVFRNRDVINFGSVDYFNLEIAEGTAQLPSEIRVVNDFVLSGGTLESNGNSLFIGRSWNQTGGTFTAGTAAGDLVAFTGNGSISGQPTFQNLTIANGSGITLSSDITINGNILLNGTLNGSSRRIRVGGNWTRGLGSFNAQTSLVEFIAGTGPSQILGNNTFNILASSAAGKTLQFETGRTQTFNDLDVVGVDGNRIILRGTADANWTFLNLKGSPAVVSFVNVEYGQVDDAGSSIQALDSSLDVNTDTGPDGSFWDDQTPVTRTWSGSGDVSNWQDPDNWDPSAAPAENDSFIIPEVANYPALTADITVFDLTIHENAELTTSADITINGSLSNSGTIIRTGGNGQNISKTDPTSGTVRYAPDPAETYTIQTYPGVDYFNLEIVAGTAQLAGDLDVAGDFTLSGGSFVQTSGITSFVGAEPSVVAGTPEFYDLSIDKSANGVTIQDGLTIGNDLIINSGGLTLDANLVVTDSINLLGGSLAVGENTITLAGNWNRSGGTFSPGTGTVAFADADKTSVISGSNAFNNLGIEVSAKSIRFAAGTTQTVSELTVTGTSADRVMLRSTVSGSSWNLDVPDTATLSNVFLSDAHLTGADITFNGAIEIAGLTIDGDFLFDDSDADLLVSGFLSATGQVNVTSSAFENTAAGTIQAGNDEPITLTTNSITIGASISGTDSVLTLQPVTTTRSIGIAGGAGDFSLTQAEIDRLQDGFASITIGRDNGEHNITINPATFIDPVVFRTPDGGSITVAGQITGADNASLTFNGSGVTTTLNADVVTAGNPVTFDDAVILGANVTIDTTDGSNEPDGADITFNVTIDADAVANNRTLALIAGTGNVTLSGAVGGTQPLGVLTVSSAAVAEFGANVTTAGEQSVTAGTIRITEAHQTTDNAISLTGDLVLLGNTELNTGTGAGDITVTGTINANDASVQTLGLTAGDGSIDLQDAVGVTALGSLTVVSAAEARFRGDVTTSGVQEVTADTIRTNGTHTTAEANVTLTGAVDLQEDTVIHTGAGGGNVSLTSTVDAAVGDEQGLTVTSGSGTITITGAIGETRRLKHLRLETTGGGFAAPALSVSEDLRLFFGGEVTQSGRLLGTTLHVRTRLDGGASITLDNENNNFTTVVLETRNAANSADADGAISYRDIGGFDLGDLGDDGAGIRTTADTRLQAGNGVTQTGPVISGGLELVGTGPYTLTNTANTVTTLAANLTADEAALSYTDTDGFAVGTVTTVGITTNNGTVTLASEAGNLQIEQSIAAGNAIVDITAGEGVSQGVTGHVSTTGTGTISVTAGGGSITMDAAARATTVDGTITYSATSNVALGLLESTNGGNITVTADSNNDDTGAITDARDNNDVNLVTTGTVTLSARTGIGAATADDALDTTIGILAATNRTSGGIYIRETGALTVGGAGVRTLNGNGPVVVDLIDGTLTVNAVVTAHGSGNILLQAQGTDPDRDITVNADVRSTSGNISVIAAGSISTDAEVDIQTGNGGTIDVEASAGSVTMSDDSRLTSATGDIRVLAGDSIAVAGIATDGTAGSVSLTATAGSITDAGDADVDVVANQLRMVAGVGIGAGNALETTVNTVSARSTSGGIFLLETDDLIVGDTGVTVQRVGANAGVTPTTDATQSDVRTTADNGAIVLRTTNGSITLNEGTAPAGNTAVVAHGSGNILLQAQGADCDIAVNADVESTSGNISVIAARSISTAATVDI